MPSTPPDDVGAEDAAFAALYRAQFAFVWRAVRALGVGAAHVEDVVQEVFVVARRKLATFDQIRSERGWLFGIARNESLSFRRKSARYARRIQRLDPGLPPPQPDDILQMREAAAFLDAFLDQLEESVRLSFVLAELEGMSGREVAQALDVPMQTHYSRLRAARRKLAAFAAHLEGSVPREGTDG